MKTSTPGGPTAPRSLGTVACRMPVAAALMLLVLRPAGAQQADAGFTAEEATIADVHAAIMSGDTTCVDVVEAHIARARAYNGICTALLTEDGAPVAQAEGAIRAGAPQLFPTATVKASTVFPDLDEYEGLPLELGTMEATVSDPSVMQQMGLRVGIPDAGQVNALETLNIRGERSVSCKGEFDRHPSEGPLPPDAPAACEELRQQPDALERAAELDAQHGTSPDLTALPMYCAVIAFKDPYDTKDMRTTSNNDVNFAMDVPPFDSTLVAQLRNKGAIIYAKTVNHEFNAGPGNPGGPHEAATNWPAGGHAISAWSGQSCNPYDTERVPRGSSGGTGAAIGANLAMIGICEQSGASCQGPASRNGLALILTTKGIVPDSGGIGNQWFNDRAGILARTLGDAARTLDAMRDPETGYFDPRDPFTAIPDGLVPEAPYASFIVDDTDLAADPKPLGGMRIAILREHMVKETLNHVAISDQIDAEIKSVLRDQLGAEILELRAKGYPDDPNVPDLEYTFADALSEILPRFMPEIFSRRDENGELYFGVDGYDVTSYDYLLELSRLKAPLTPEVTMVNFAGFAAIPCHNNLCADTLLGIDRYLAERGDERITDWAAWVENAKFRQQASLAGARNWVEFDGHTSEGKADRLARSYIARFALLKLMYENDIDAFVHPENIVPTPKIGGANVGRHSLDGITPFFQIPRIVVPAGVTEVVHEPEYALTEDATDYEAVLPPDSVETRLRNPMPISITFFAGQGDEPTLIRIGTAYESATHHRFAPPDFGPVAEKWNGHH